MNTIIRGLPINYSAVDVGVLEAPDRIGRYNQLTDSELEKRFQKVYKELLAKEKPLSFERKKDTPPMVKYIVGGGILYYSWQKIKGIFKK